MGKANETDVEIDGIISKALIDSSAMILMMSKDYCYEHGYKIWPLERLVPIEGIGGASVPYLGYVEVRMHIPRIDSFDRDVLLLISSTTAQYHQRLPIQVGLSLSLCAISNDVGDHGFPQFSISSFLKQCHLLVFNSSFSNPFI